MQLEKERDSDITEEDVLEDANKIMTEISTILTGADMLHFATGSQFSHDAFNNDIPKNWKEFKAAGGSLYISPHEKKGSMLKELADSRDAALARELDDTNISSKCKSSNSKKSKKNGKATDQKTSLFEIVQLLQLDIKELNQQRSDDRELVLGLQIKVALLKEEVDSLQIDAVTPLRRIYRREVAVSVCKALCTQLGRQPIEKIGINGNQYLDWVEFWSTVTDAEARRFFGGIDSPSKMAVLKLSQVGKKRGNVHAHEAYKLYPDRVAEAIADMHSTNWDTLFALFKQHYSEA